ncbi:MAG: DEAD/DEAH box helicase family protein [Acidobacteriota bacterium]|nr:DEAD/DEAH box helicase family protein [Acidobacteriota bacterium]
MNKHVNSIAQRLSLRPPQRQSLEILAEVLGQIELAAEPTETLQLIRGLYPSVNDFERDFPSLCFALATGVGKTRLMGAFIAYLHATEVSRHFFVLAPNLTIYEKLIQDFTPNTPKYVFRGMEQYAVNPPVVVTGENYEDGRGVRLEQTSQLRMFESERTAFINIFNISKINSEVRGGALPRMKRLQEYIGESYFNYLAELDDLVLLMDEAHRYRASAGAKAISELKPILGLELTATPKAVGAKAEAFKNVIYSYPLSAALNDGFTKEPAVATRKDFKPEDYSAEQLERIKLEDGIHHHEFVKVELENYARETNSAPVKPFVLVVAQETEHARQLQQIIEAEDFFNGRYRGRVIQVHSNLRGEESDENTKRLLAVETDAETEIVIHVNKLKEGWDVTNLYTIVPLRASASEILTEQTIGRGLRLPFGKRTGVDSIDRLTIIAHDKFQAIVDAANSPDSIIRQQVTIGEGGDIPIETPQSVVVPSVLETLLTGNATVFGNEPATNQPPVLFAPREQEVATVVLDVLKKYERLESSARLQEPEIQRQIIAETLQVITPAQFALPGVESDLPKTVERVVGVVTEKIVELTIDVPRIVLIPSQTVSFGFKDFDLEGLDKIHLQPVSREILIQQLRTNERASLMWEHDQPREERLEDYLVSALMNYDEIDYDEHADLLYKLSGQLIARLRGYLRDDREIENVLLYHQRSLTEFVYRQMMQHYWETPVDYQVKISKGFSTLRPNSFTLPAGIQPRDFRVPLSERNSIRQLVFGGFRKCCYPFQKFDSDTERRFAVLLEDDATVLRWMKPASGHLRIEHKTGAGYEPDFVIETAAEKLLCETKMASQFEDGEVRLKAQVARQWCDSANQHAAENGGKTWRYLLIPHDEVTHNASLYWLQNRFQN